LDLRKYAVLGLLLLLLDLIFDVQLVILQYVNFGLESSASLLNRLDVLVHLGHCVFELLNVSSFFFCCCCAFSRFRISLQFFDRRVAFEES
jgi:hypothetical protein